MNLQDLLKKRLVEKTEPDLKSAAKFLKNAEKDLYAAEDILKTRHADWALAIAYNAMLSAGMALLAFKGYRAYSESHHAAIVQFCAAVMPAESVPLVHAFDRYRIRRHDVVYGEGDSVGEDEARRAIEKAKEFVGKVKELAK